MVSSSPTPVIKGGDINPLCYSGVRNSGWFPLTGCGFFAYNWKLPAYSGAFLQWESASMIRALRDCKQRSSTVSKKTPTVSKKASPVSKRVVLADAPVPWNPQKWNKGTKNGASVPKTGARARKTERQTPKAGKRAHSPKPPFYKTALLFPLKLWG